MREEIKKEINDIFNSTSNINDLYTNNDQKINELVDNQNKKALNDIKYRKELLDKLDSLKELGFIIDYNDKMTNEELEDIINSVNY